MDKSPDAFRTISEVADWLGVQAHVLRFWESKFTQVKPVKRAGGRRYYRPSDMQLIGGIKKLLHDDGLTIKGAQKLLREQGVAHVAAMSQSLDEMAGMVVASKEAEPTVVAFTSKQAGAAAKDHAPIETDAPRETPETAPTAPDSPPADVPAPGSVEATKADAVPEATPAPETDGPHEEEVAVPDAESEAEPEQPDLPSFLHRPKEEPKRPDVIEAPDPVADDAMPYAHGALARLSTLSKLSAAEAEAIAPLADALRAWRDRTIGTTQV